MAVTDCAASSQQLAEYWSTATSVSQLALINSSGTAATWTVCKSFTGFPYAKSIAACSYNGLINIDTIVIEDAVVDVCSNKVLHIFTLKNALLVSSAQRNLTSGEKNADFTFTGSHGMIKFYYPNKAPF